MASAWEQWQVGAAAARLPLLSGRGLLGRATGPMWLGAQGTA